ncbi:sugar ABC transporter substrate-binding protein [Pseudonocardia xishanensis]
MKPVTTFVGPTESFTPVKDKHIMVLVCGNFGKACIRLGEGAKQAAESLGWRVDMVDGRLDPTVWNRAVKQAVDAGIDGIVSVAADPNLMGEAMAAVNAKHVPFVMISQSPKPGDVPGVRSWIRPDAVKGGTDVGTWIAADSGDKGSALLIDLPDYADIMKRNDAIADTLTKTCQECTVHRVTGSSQTVGTSLAPLVTSQLQQHPDVNYVWSPDDAVSNFVAQGIQQAGKSATVKLVSGAGEPEALAKIKAGTHAADLASPNNFMGWLAGDALIRAISGVPVQDVWDVPQRFFSAVNINDGGPDLTEVGWNVEFDYRDQLKKMWGLT